MTRNVVVVVMDTARYADVFPDGETVAPTLESLAEEGVRFDRAIAPSPWTLPSHASLFTGTYPSKHGTDADHPRLAEGLATVPEAFARAGHETVAVSNNTWISPEFGFDRGFETFFRTWQRVQTDTDLGHVARTTEGRETVRELLRAVARGNPLTNLVNAVYGRFLRKRRDSGARRTNRWIRSWLDGRDGDRPFFLFVNYLEPHLEYRPPRETAAEYLPPGWSYEEAMALSQDAWSYVAGDLDHSDEEFAALRALYRGEIAYLDDRLADLRESLIAADAWEDTIVVVTSDHGENVGDHGLMDHQYCLYDTVVRVPLVVRGGPFTGGDVDERVVSLTDLAPTLCDVADLDDAPVRASAQGATLVPGERPDRDRVFAEYRVPQPSMAALEQRVGDLSESARRYDRRLRAVRTADWKFVRGSDGTRECYHLASDPGERDDRVDRDPDRAGALAASLDGWLASFDHADREGEGGASMSAATRARLEDLGYLRE